MEYSVSYSYTCHNNFVLFNHHDNNANNFVFHFYQVISFDVDFDEVPKRSPLTKAQLHICNDRICLSTNLEYDFKLLGEWQIDSLSQRLMTQGGVTLNMTSEAQEEKTLLLRTERGHEICSKLTERRRCLAPADHQQFQYTNSVHMAALQQCDGNSNIMSASSLSKSCELVHQIHFEALPSQSRTLPSSKVKPSLSLRELPSLSNLSCNLQAKSPLSSDGSICKDEFGSTNSSSSASTEKGSNSDNELNVQKQVELTAHKVHADGNGTKDGEESSTRENHIRGEHLPPPVPERNFKPQRNFKPTSTSTVQVKNELHDNTKCSDRNIYGEELVIQRSRSFQIVEQPPSCPKRQRFKSDSSLSVAKTAITELVQPICLDQPPSKPENHLDTFRDLQVNRSAGTKARKAVFPLKQDERNNISCVITRDGVDTSTGKQNRSLTHTYCMPAPSSSDTQAVDEKSQFTDKVDSSDSTCHYVNLPEGSRPSCYLYMNLPNPRMAPKEAASCVSHVFMSRSMKGIYENVQQFYNDKFETAVSSEESASPPPLPPPPLEPRPPPPRIPRRESKDSKGTQKPPVALPVQTRDPFGPPPPRPPKKQISVTNLKVCN